MSTSKENHNSTTSDEKSRIPLKQTSTLLFDHEHDSSYQAGYNLKQDIAAVSLSIDSLDTRIPTLTPTTDTTKIPPMNPQQERDNEGALKSSQLHYLEANKALANKAILDADTASQILLEAKATQLAILENVEENKEASLECKKNIKELEAGLLKCQKILRESRFIHNEIEKLYSKTQQQTALDSSHHTAQVTRLITELQDAKKTLTSLENFSEKNIKKSQKTLQEIQKELEACHTTRQHMESKKDILDSEVEASRVQIKAITQDALTLIKNSENNLSTSKTGQTSYIALSREITALRQELKVHKKNTIHLSGDIESANKAIALNTTAVEAITTDLLHIKHNIKVSKSLPTVTHIPTQDEQQKISKLIDEAQSTHKRIHQLLELNNTVSDRIGKVDKAIYENAQKQEIMSTQQEQALQDIGQQREVCQKLIDQANRSHTLIVSACKKTSMLANMIDETTHEEKKSRQEILTVLNENKAQKNALQKLQNSLEKTHEKQIESLIILDKAHQDLIQDEQNNKKILSDLKENTIELKILTPEIKNQKNKANELLSVLAQTIENSNKTNQALQALQSKMADSLSEHKDEQQQLQNSIASHIKKYTLTHEGLQHQQQRVQVLEKDFLSHVATLDELSHNIQQKISDLATEYAANETISKDIDFSKTELRYLKEQCDKLLKECIDQSRLSQKNEETTSKSIDILNQLETKVSQSIETQQSQECGLDQLNTMVNTALNDLNTKIDQFEHLHARTHENSLSTSELQSQISETSSQQKKSQKDINFSLQTIASHIEHSTEQKSQFDALHFTLEKNAQEQARTIDNQNQKLHEQNTVLTAQNSLLHDVKETYESTQASLAAITQIRKKAQQSFAHLGAQKTKFEAAFAQSFEKLKQQDIQQEKQEALLQATVTVIDKLNASTQRADAFEKWQKDTSKDITTKLQHIDEYQSRAFQAQKAAQAKESQLEEKHQEVQQRLNQLNKLIENLDSTRIEEAQYRDELRALVQHHEQQQHHVDSQLNASQDRHDSLSRSLEDAHLMFRENKLATKETQMANRETKLILQEIRKEISSVKQAGWQEAQAQNLWKSEDRIDTLESQLSKPRLEEPKDQSQRTHQIEDSVSHEKPYKPSSFML